MQYESAVKLGTHRAMTREGYLLCTDCPIAAVGGREYLADEAPGVTPGPDGRVRLFRDASQLFAPETVASFEGKPLTLGHPPGTIIGPSEWRSYAVGHVQNVHRGEGAYSDSLLADLIIYEPQAIEAIGSGEAQELSIGFTSRTDEVAPGTAYESEIVGNHVAIVPQGRNGPLVAIRQDAKTLGGSIMGFFKRADADPAGGGAGTDPAAAPDIAQLLTAIQEKLAAFDQRLAALEGAAQAPQAPAADADTDEEKQPAAYAAPAPADEEKKDEETPQAAPTAPAPLTADDVAKIVAQVLQAQTQSAKADAAIITDAAVVAPGLSKETPDLARAALAEYAKTESGARLLAAYGGLAKIKADAAPGVLKAAAIHEMCRQDEAASAGRVRFDAAPARADFFAEAAKLWEN